MLWDMGRYGQKREQSYVRAVRIVSVSAKRDVDQVSDIPEHLMN
jgi:hypothetical protein